MKRTIFFVLAALLIVSTVAAMMPDMPTSVDIEGMEDVEVDYTQDSVVVTTDEGVVTATPEQIQVVTAEGEVATVTTTAVSADAESGEVDVVADITVKGKDGVTVNAKGVSVKATTSAQVQSMIKNQGDLSQVSAQVGAVQVMPGKVMAGGAVVETEGDVMTVSTPSGNVIQITSGEGAVKLEENIQGKKFSINAAGVTVENNMVKVGNVVVKMPSEFLDLEELEEEIEDIELELEGEKPMYRIQKTAQKRFLGLVSVSVGEEVSVDAESGEKVSVKGPWWSFLAWG